MLAKFKGGPYDRIALHLPVALPYVNLPISVRTTLKMCDRTLTTEVKYRCTASNDVEAEYEFEAVRM